MSVQVSVFPVLFISDRRREASKRAVLLHILWEYSWVEDSNLYGVSRQGKSEYWDSALSKHHGWEQKNRTWERPSACTFLDTESINWETQIWRRKAFLAFWFMQNCLLGFNLWVTCVHLLILLNWDAFTVLKFLSYAEPSHLSLQ